MPTQPALDPIIFSAAFPTSVPVPGPSGTAVRIRDVLMFETVSPVDVTPVELAEHPPVASSIETLHGMPDDPFPLRDDLVIGRLEDDERDLVLNACSRRGHNFHPHKQFGQRYTLIRELPVEDHKSHDPQWDHDGVLYDVLALSRMIRENMGSTQYAARIQEYPDGQKRVCWAGTDSAKMVYRLDRRRDWLDRSEAAELKVLANAFWESRGTLPGRVTRASWRLEYSFWLAWVDVVLPTVVSGLEALLKVGRDQMTKQFKTRVPRLAQELGIDGLDEKLCGDIYSARSDWVHGNTFEFLDDDVDKSDADRVHAIVQLRAVLRAATRRAIEDADFRATFESDESVVKSWAP